VAHAEPLGHMMGAGRADPAEPRDDAHLCLSFPSETLRSVGGSDTQLRPAGHRPLRNILAPAV
jgi:hypothetical protein